MLKIYIYWHKCWCHRCGTGQQVKIVLLSFWSVNRWVSQYPTLKGCFTDRAGIVNNLIYFPSTRQVDSSSWIFVLIENYIGTLSLTDIVIDWLLMTDNWSLITLVKFFGFLGDFFGFFSEMFWISRWNVMDFCFFLFLGKRFVFLNDFVWVFSLTTG